MRLLAVVTALLVGLCVTLLNAHAAGPETVDVCVGVREGYVTGQWQGHSYVKRPLYVSVAGAGGCDNLTPNNLVALRPLDSVAPGQWLYGEYTRPRSIAGFLDQFTVRVFQGLRDPSLIYVSANDAPAQRVVLEGRRATANYAVWSGARAEASARAQRVAEASTRRAAEQAESPEPTDQPEPSITVTLETSSTQEPVLIATVEANRLIPAQQAILLVAAKGQWHGMYSARALEPGVASDDFGHRPYPMTWQNVVEVKLRTLAGNTLRHWACEQVEDRHAIYGEYVCAIGEEQPLPSLSNVESASLWVYVLNRRTDGLLDIHARAGVENVGNITVEARGDSVCIINRTHQTRPLNEVWQTIDLIAGGSCSREHDGQNSHEHTDAVTVQSTGLGLLRCEKHDDSDARRSVFACDRW